MGGYQQESSKKEILRICTSMDDLMENEEDDIASPLHSALAGVRSVAARI